MPVGRLVVHGVGAFGAGSQLIAGEEADVRYVVIDHEHVRLAPWIGAATVILADGAWAGVALEAGGRVLSFDVSAPLVGLTEAHGRAALLPYPELFVVTNLGLTWHVTPTEGVRLGAEDLGPSLAWRGELGRTVLEARIAAMPFRLVGTSFRVGYVF